MSDIKDHLFGRLASLGHFVTEAQVEEAIAAQQLFEQSGQPVPPLGEVLVQKGYMTIEQVKAVLNGQNNRKARFGEVTIQWKLCSQASVQAALAFQTECRARGDSAPRIGEILVTRGLIKAHQVHAILQTQGKAIVRCPHCKTRYNVMGLIPGASLDCGRCKKTFYAVAEEPLATGNGTTLELRSDLTQQAPAVTADDGETAPGKIGPYQILSRLGADHSGVLYKASDPGSQQAVVIRVLSEQIMRGTDDFERWVAAGRAASELNHPNLQRILMMGSENNHAYLVMEFIKGQSLRQRLRDRGALPLLEALDILIQIAQALAYGHAHDLIHGDLHPRHVLVGQDRRVRLGNLGTPKKIMQDLRLMAQISGSLPLYAAPEVLIDEGEADERSDLYSLCALGYHLVTGKPPLEGRDLLQAGFMAASGSIVPAQNLVSALPSYVNRVLLKGLSSEPEGRYETADALLADLRKCRAGAMLRRDSCPDVAPLAERPAPPRRAIQTRQRVRTGDRRKGTYLVRQPRAGGFGSFHTVAVASLAAVVAVSVIYFSRPARDNRAGPLAESQKGAEQLDLADKQKGPRLLQKEFSDRVLAYQRDHPEDYNGIRYRADLFVQLYGAKYPDTEPVKEAATIRLVQSRIAAAKTRDALGERVQELILKDRFKDAQFEVVRWGSYWGPDAAGTDEKFLLDRIRTAQQSHATAWLAQGRAKRAEGSWDSARALFRKTEEQFGAEYAEQACVEESITDEAEQQAKAGRDEAALQKEKERVAAQRDAAAPVLLRKLVNDIQDPLAKLQFPLALKTAADAEPAFKGTGQHAAYKSIRTALQRIEGLLDRTVQACKEDRLRDFTLRVKDWDGQIVDATREGPVVKNATVQAAVAWSSLELPVLISIFERCTNNTKADEVLDLALFQIYRGELKAGQDLLNSAQQLGAQVEPHRELLQVVRWVVDAPGPKVPVADHDRELNEEAGTLSALKGMDWEVSRGRWEVNPDFSLEGTPEPGTTLMSLHRQVPKFDRIEVEVRGQGDSVGFSLGKGRRFMARPIYLWQKLSLHMVGGNKLELRVDGETRASLEAVQTTQDPILPDLYLRGLGSRIEFRNFAIDGNIVRPNIAPAATTPAAIATEGAPIPKVPELKGMKDL